MLETLSLLWLAPLAFYDLKKREIPHKAFVAIPLLLAVAYAARRGDWPLALAAVVVELASERHFWKSRLALPVAVTLVVVTTAMALLHRPEATPGILMVVGFWLTFELGWSAAVDSLATITLALLWPGDVRLLLTLSAAHLFMALLLRKPLHRPRLLGPDELQTLGAPGLPAIALGLAQFAAWRAWLP